MSARRAVGKNEDLVVDALRAIDPFLTTNLSVNQISEMITDLTEYEILPVITPGGELKMGESFAEFWPNEASVWDCIHISFCKR